MSQGRSGTESGKLLIRATEKFKNSTAFTANKHQNSEQFFRRISHKKLYFLSPERHVFQQRRGPRPRHPVRQPDHLGAGRLRAPARGRVRGRLRVRPGLRADLLPEDGGEAPEAHGHGRQEGRAVGQVDLRAVLQVS